MKRRSLVKTASAMAAGMVLSKGAKAESNNTIENPRSTYVLVHGTWHGGWVWQDVATILRRKGHVVYCPTLTGCGQRKHLANPDIGLETHITDVTNLIEYEELENVILIAHSFSGVVITGVADRLKDKIKHIIFFDALVPNANASPISIIQRTPDGKLPDFWLKKKEGFIDGYLMDFWADYPIDMLLPESAIKERKRVKKLITLHPARTWEQQVVLKNRGWEDLNRTFIHCVGQTYKQSSEQMVGPARSPGWQFMELNIPRNGMLTHPELLASTFNKMSAIDFDS